LINHRYNARLATVFTTNVWPDGIEQRIASRMADQDLSGGVIQIQAEDYRQRKARRT
jgi:DNA replication protein DnaC